MEVDIREQDDCHGGSIYFDGAGAIVIKVYDDRQVYEREVGAYLALGSQSWLPKLLGTGTIRSKPALLTTFEGTPISEEKFDDLDTQHFLARCIQEMHRCNIHHHDMASRNVLVRPDGTICITDFGDSMQGNVCKGLGEQDRFYKCLDEEFLEQVALPALPASYSFFNFRFHPVFILATLITAYLVL